MGRLKILCALILIVLFGPSAARAMTAYTGWCELGGKKVVTSGLQSTTTVQQSYPSCQVTVYNPDNTLAALFSDNGVTSLSNPFTATTAGLFSFFAANGTYKVVVANAGSSTTITENIGLFDVASYQPHVVEAYQLGGASGIVESQSGDVLHVAGFKAASTMPASLIWQFPRVDAAGCWQSDGSLVLSLGPCPAAGSDKQIQYNKTGVLAGDANFTWNYGTPTLTVNGNVDTVNGLTSGTFYARPNAANNAGGYVHFANILYPNTTCLDIYGNPVNQPFALGGDTFGANDAVLWLSASPLAGVNPPGCATAFPLQETYGLNLNTYFLAMGGLATTDNAYNSIQSLSGGAYVRLGYLSDQAVYLQVHASSSTLNNPSASCVQDSIPNCYGALAYQGGSLFWYFNSTTRTWNSVDFSSSGGGGSPGGPSSAVQFNNGGVFGGVAALEWNSGLNQLVVTTTGATAGIGVANGYIQSDKGFLATTGTCTSFNCIQAPTGGVEGLSITAANYVQTGNSSGVPPLTSSDSFHAGALYYDIVNACEELFNGATWSCIGTGGSSTPPYTTTVSSVSSLSISAATHGQGTLPTAFCYDSATPRLAVGCSYTRDASGNLAFTFSPAFTGLVQVNGGGGGGGSGTPGGPSTSIQFNSASTFAGSANLEWDGAKVVITTASSVTAGIAIANGFGQADSGFIATSGTCLAFSCIQAPTGGMAAISFSATGYIQTGHNTNPPGTGGNPLTVGDALHAGAMFYSDAANCEQVWNGTVWACIGSGGGGLAPGGPATAVQFNATPAGTFNGSANFEWNNTTQQLTITGLTATAGIVVSTAFIQSDQGFLSRACTNYNCFQPVNGGGSLSGGMAALSFTAANYVQTGNASIGSTSTPPTITTGDTFHPGAMYYDTSSSAGGPCERVYTGSSWVCLTTAIASGVSSMNLLSGALNIAGTANEISVAPAGTTITLSTPQPIGTGSTPQFLGVIAQTFNSTATGSTIGFQLSNTNLQVDGNGDLSMVGQLALNSGGFMKVTNGNCTNIFASTVYGLANCTTGATMWALAGGPNGLLRLSNGTGVGGLDGNGAQILLQASTGGIQTVGDVSASGVFASNGVSGGFNVTADTAFNSIQTIGGVFASRDITAGRHYSAGGGSPSFTCTGAGCGVSCSFLTTCNDTRGIIQSTAGSTSTITVHFAAAFANTPVCVISSDIGAAGALAPWILSPNTSDFTIRNPTGIASGQFWEYICIQ